MKKLAEELKELSWVLGGTGLVLITLSGSTLKWGVGISIASLLLYVFSAIVSDS